MKNEGGTGISRNRVLKKKKRKSCVQRTRARTIRARAIICRRNPLEKETSNHSSAASEHSFPGGFDEKSVEKTDSSDELLQSSLKLKLGTQCNNIN